jgi:hypothetical protein
MTYERILFVDSPDPAMEVVEFIAYVTAIGALGPGRTDAAGYRAEC